MSTSATGPEPLKDLTRGLKQPRAWLPLLLVAQVWLLVNGQAVLGRQFDTSVGLFYLLLILVALLSATIYAVVGNKHQEKFLKELFRGTLREYALKFVLGFMVTWALFVAIFQVGLNAPVRTLAYSSVWPLVVLQAAFVTPAEELFFRGYLPHVFDPKGKSWRIYMGTSLADAFTAVTFSGFHYAAYGPDAGSAFAITFLLALVWMWTSRLMVGAPFHFEGKRPLGIPFTIGSHLAWNLCVFGLLVGGVLLGV